jgi:hypothetical protein
LQISIILRFRFAAVQERQHFSLTKILYLMVGKNAILCMGPFVCSQSAFEDVTCRGAITGERRVERSSALQNVSRVSTLRFGEVAHQQAGLTAGCVKFVSFPGLQACKHFANGLLYRVKLCMTKIHICNRLPTIPKLSDGLGMRGCLYKISSERGFGGKGKLLIQRAAVGFNAAERKYT